MAHGDYDCCALCDSKLNYNAWEARTKEDLCTGCLKVLHGLDIMVYDGEELHEWIRSHGAEEVVGKLGPHINQCFYDNLIDRAFAEHVAVLEEKAEMNKEATP